MRSNIKSKRIGNLEFCMSSYLLPERALPEHIGFSINKYYPNPYYGKKHEYKKIGDFYYGPKDDLYTTMIHESCFDREESHMVIASWDWDDKDCCYNFEFIGNRPLELNEEERKVFWELLEYGFGLLNGDNENEQSFRRFWKHPFKYDGYGNIVDATGAVLVFSFDRNALITDDFIENMIRLLNGYKDATEMKYFDLDSDGYLTIRGAEDTPVGKFRGYENVEEYYKYCERPWEEAWDTWQYFLGFCDNRLKKND